MVQYAKRKMDRFITQFMLHALSFTIGGVAKEGAIQ